MPQIEVSEEILAKIKEQFGSEVEPIEINDFSDLVGKKMFFRTVTVYTLGKVKKQIGNFLVIEKGSWIADTKRFHDFIKDGVTSSVEVEPFGECLLNINSIVDAFYWKHDLPTHQQ